MGEFSVKFRGIRGSYPVADKDFLRFGGNTSCVEVNAGGHSIILDAGTGIIKIGEELMSDYICSGVDDNERTPINTILLLSHIHQDHLQGFNFFNPLHLNSTKINVFANVPSKENLSDELSKILFGKSFPLELADIACDLKINNLTEDDTIILRKGCEPQVVKLKQGIEPQYDDVLIQNYKSYAHPKDGVVIYKISYRGKTLVYATDKESYLGGDKKLVNFARNCSLLIHDAQYTTEDYLNQFAPKQGYGHSTFDMALEVQRQTGAEQLVFFHLNPSYNDDKLDKIKEHYESQYPVKMAYEGLEIDLI